MTKKLSTVTRKGTRLDQLKTLAQMLAKRLDMCSEKETAQLAKQYREVIYEIEEIEGRYDGNDEISEILKNRESDGKSDPDRQSSSKLN